MPRVTHIYGHPIADSVRISGRVRRGMSIHDYRRFQHHILVGWANRIWRAT